MNSACAQAHRTAEIASQPMTATAAMPMKMADHSPKAPGAPSLSIAQFSPTHAKPAILLIGSAQKRHTYGKMHQE